MKALLILLLSLTGVLAAPPGVMRTSISLTWDYPAGELSTNMTFYFFSTTNLTTPYTNWPMVARMPGTNTSITLPIDANQRSYIMASSNWWGGLFFSNIVTTEAPPRWSNLNLSIGP